MLLLCAVRQNPSGVQIYDGDVRFGESIVICCEMSSCHLFRGGGGLVGYPLPPGEVISFLYRKCLVEDKHRMWESEVW